LLKLVFFTGNRAEFGLLAPIIIAFNKIKKFEVSIMVSGDHLNQKTTSSFKEIDDLGIKNIIKVPIKFLEDSNLGALNYIGDAVKSYSNIFNKIEPDFVFVYADRFEGFAAIIASSLQNIKTIHMEGGDVTEGGAHDDNIRHAMTKLSHIHLATNEPAYNRILAMGEEAWRVFNVGLPAIDQIKAKRYMSEKDIKKIIPIAKANPIILFTQHSIASQYNIVEKQILPSLKALEYCLEKNFKVIITFPNNDPGGKEIIKYLNIFKKKHNSNPNLYVTESLGRNLYHGLLALVENHSYNLICVGNSSSGVKETILFKVPTVNIGDRQKGRLKSDNIIETNYDEKQIFKSILKGLYNKNFRDNCKTATNFYGSGNTVELIKKIILNLINDKNITKKKMMLAGIKKNGWFK